jgi:hypothetical protein
VLSRLFGLGALRTVPRVRFLPAPHRSSSSIPGEFAGRLTQAPGVLAATRDEATVLLDAARGRYHTLNAVGGRVWALLASGTTREALVRALGAEYALPAGVTTEQIDRDVIALLTQLRAAGLLEEAPRAR